MSRLLIVSWVAACVLLVGGCNGGARPAKPTQPASTKPAATTQPAAAFAPLFPGDRLEGWRVSHWSDVSAPQQQRGPAWKLDKGVLYGLGKRTWIFSEAEHADFVLAFEVKISRGANGGVGLRFPPKGDPAYTGLEIQVVDHEVYYRGQSRPEQRTGSLYDEIAATKDASTPVGQWSAWEITARGSRITIVINGRNVLDADLSGETKARQQKGPPLARRPRKGRIGFQNLNGLITLRKLRIKKR
jgi:hypothetical protein